VRFPVLVADIDCLFDPIVLEGLSYAGSKLARLLLGRGISKIPLNHDRDRVDGHDQEHDHGPDRDAAHMLDHFSNGELLLKAAGVRTRRSIL
jgi:hypothetical protein